MSEHLPPTHTNLINNTRLETAGQTALTDLRSRIRHKVEACAFLSNCPFWQHLTETLGKSRCTQGGQSQAVLPNRSGVLCSGVEADCSRLIDHKTFCVLMLVLKNLILLEATAYDVRRKLGTELNININLH